MKFVVVLALVIVLTLVIVAATWKNHAEPKPPPGARTSYARSDGTFDDAARSALRNNTGNGPADHLLSATIITRNALAQENKTASVPESKRRLALFNEARRHYGNALRGIQRDLRAAPVQGAAAPRATGRGRGMPNPPPRTQRTPPWAAGPRVRPGEFPPAFAIDAALVFAVLGQQMLREGDPLINDMMQDQIILMDIPLMNEARKTREQLIEQRAAAAAAAPTPAKKVATYIGMATEHADDHENVHDTGVNGSLRAIVQRLRHDQQDAQLPAIDKIKQEIGTMLVGDPKKLKDVSDVIDRAKNGDRNMAVGISDEEALQRVWLRADDPRNSAVRKQMKEATVKALEEAWKNDPWGGRTIRCVNGRSGLTLSSLVLLDHDQRNWHITTFEQVKNDILRKVHEYIGKRAAEAAGSPDPRLAKVGQSYLVKTSEELQALGELDQELTTKYVEEVREGIGKLVDEEAAAANKRMSGSLTAAFIEGAKKEAQAAVV